MRHELKCDHEQFELMLQGKMKFDVRSSDRNFRVGDILIQRETHFNADEMNYNDKELIFTGQRLNCLVTHMFEGPIPTAWGIGSLNGISIMSIGGVFLQWDNDEVAAYKNFLGEQ
jgi:hypothetical protein